nr:immunoglobulin light chain junction region [Macaca mulatta]MOV61865.1 immunoglobulin light chain junction region [Macaca mulatta]MOV62064.1 immunoglobulin light chain junction region [Macaca mulatta]MOV62809.1 immunoglobulin light chain junction region [Macaca mulatta]MOV63115.1 immunoglobulin light chain junction region [Macaca mulatta]
CQHYNTYPQTF